MKYISIAATCLYGLFASFAGHAQTRPPTNHSLDNDRIAAFLAPKPRQIVGSYEYMGKYLTKEEACGMVQTRGLSCDEPQSYQRLGMVLITDELIERGKQIFNERKIGDVFGLQRVFGFGEGLKLLLPELAEAIAKLEGRPTTNLQLKLQKEIRLGSHTFPAGTVINTGMDMEPDGEFPVGFLPDGNVTCAACHVTLDESGRKMQGVPNGDLNIAALIAISPNSASGFARLAINPLAPELKGKGRVILDSKGNKVELPDPEKIERLMDDLVMSAPLGNFESSTDSINNTVQIPNVFTFGAGPYLADGEFGVGPFAGVSAVSNAVHSSEINLIEAAQRAEISQGIDSEIYLGIALQNAVDPAIRLPSDKIVKPSQWLREVAPDVYFAELEDQIAVPGAGVYPFLKPSLFTYNGLVFSPRSGNSSDIASGPFLFAANAMAAFQNSLVPPANKSPANEAAIASGSVRRGAAVFADAGCASCHKPPFFTDNKIHKWRQIRTNPARGQSRLALEPYLVPPKLYSFDTPVPPPANAEVIEVPTQEYSLAPNRLPANLAPKGGYRTTSLVGLYLSAPYLHDGGVAVGKDALKYETSGAFSIADSARLGLPGTLLRFEPADPYASLRALVDRNLRAKVIERNRSAPQLVKVNLDGTGHEFYVDEEEGYTSQQQTDLINFLMALDDNPGQF